MQYRRLPPQRVAPRDAGVSDAVWTQLQHDRRAEQVKEDGYQRLWGARTRATGADRQRIRWRILEEERRRQEKAAMRQRLEQMGICSAGYALSLAFSFLFFFFLLPFCSSRWFAAMPPPDLDSGGDLSC